MLAITKEKCTLVAIKYNLSIRRDSCSNVSYLTTFLWINLILYKKSSIYFALKMICDVRYLRILFLSHCAFLFSSSKHPSNIRRVKGLHFQSFKPSKDHTHWRFGNMILRPFEGFKDCMQSFKPSKYFRCNPSTLRRTEFAILRKFEGLWLWFYNSSNDCIQPYEGLKDCKCNPSTLRRIVCITSKVWRISFVILRRFEGSHTILQHF